MQVRVYEKVSQKPNGDRDTNTHPSSEFWVDVVNGKARTTVFKNNQFDSYWTSINGSRKTYLDEAMKFAKDFAVTLGGVEVVGVEDTVTEAKILELEASIAASTAELKRLKEKTK